MARPQASREGCSEVIFYLGSHMVTWLERANVPLMVSRNILTKRRTFPRAAAPWVLDSGGFTELQRHGRWTIDARQYARDIERVSEEIGRLVWAAPQDWMCEPVVIHGGTFKGVRFAGTGLTVKEHQARTVGNFLDLRGLGAPVIPVLQGFTLADYERCADMYERAGVNLASEPTVGLGSVCRREATSEIGAIVAAMTARNLRLHGFGAKLGAVKRYGALLESADSMAWSFGGRRNGSCLTKKSKCANCMHYALEWRSRVVSCRLGDEVQTALRLDV